MAIMLKNGKITLTLKYFQDPSHGWIECPTKVCIDLGFFDKISDYSYFRNEMIYLEEDCDANLLIKALKANNVGYDLINVDTNEMSIVRTFSGMRRHPKKA